MSDEKTGWVRTRAARVIRQTTLRCSCLFLRNPGEHPAVVGTLRSGAARSRSLEAPFGYRDDCLPMSSTPLPISCADRPFPFRLELNTHLEIARDVGYLTSDVADPVIDEADQLSRMMLALSRSLRGHRNRP